MKKGDKYGRLTAVRFDHEVIEKPVHRINRYTKKDGSVSEYKTVLVKKIPYWLFTCECGTEHVASAYNVKYRGTQSCGCLARELAAKRSVFVKGEKHPFFVDGKCNTRKSKFYRAFRGAIQRCSNPNNQKYKNYGGRGIQVKWKTYLDFKRDMYDSFLKHKEIYGDIDTTLDRIDVNGNYSKENCRWATRKEQARNTRSNVQVEVNGKKVKFVDYADSLGIDKKVSGNRLRRGWDLESIKDGKHYYRTGSMRGQEKNYALEKQQLMAIFKDSVHTAKAYLSALNEREREIIEMRFGFTNGKRNTLEEIAKAQGVTRERIRQIEAVAIEKMEDFAASIRRT